MKKEIMEEYNQLSSKSVKSSRIRYLVRNQKSNNSSGNIKLLATSVLGFILMLLSEKKSMIELMSKCYM